jgi:hypothetical protein
MSLNDLANIGQVIGAVAVVISLIYVALQIRPWLLPGGLEYVRSGSAQPWFGFASIEGCLFDGHKCENQQKTENAESGWDEEGYGWQLKPVAESTSPRHKFCEM